MTLDFLFKYLQRSSKIFKDLQSASNGIDPVLLSCFVKVVAAYSVAAAAAAAACLEPPRAQAHVTMNACFELEKFRRDELFLDEHLFLLEMVLIVVVFLGHVFRHNYMILKYFKVAHEVG